MKIVNSNVPCTIDESRTGVSFETERKNDFGNEDGRSGNGKKRLEMARKNYRIIRLDVNDEFMDSVWEWRS